MSDDLTIDRINFLSNEPLQVSLGGTPFNKAHLDARAVEIQRLETALTEARAEIERLRAKPPLLDAQSLPGVDALVKTLEAQLDEALRSCLAEREGRLKAETAISTLRARVREVVGPFAMEADGTRLCGAEFGDDWKPFLHRSYTEVDITNGHLRAACQLMEEVK